MIEASYAPMAGAGAGEWIVATVAAVESSGVQLMMPGQNTASQKLYKRLDSASLSAGDQALCIRVSGTIVVLGKIV